MRRLCFYELFDAVLFLRLMSVGEIATWVSWIEKGGLFLNAAVVYGILVFGTESVDGKQRKYFYVFNTVMNFALRWSFFVCTFSVDPKSFCYGWGRGGGGAEIRTCTTCCLRDIKDMETVIQ